MKRIRRFLAAIIALVILLVALVAVLFGLVGSATQPVVDAADKFMVAVQLGDFQAAYNLLAPATQSGLTPQALQASIPSGNLREWRWTGQSISTVAGQGSVGNVSGPTVINGASYRVVLTLNQVENAWRVTAYTFTPG
ncbi:MAG: hypothetical protein K8I60_18270 [Anaerolineae bacterium]|nr:hypothetical protein [Anaerolineae bacterium]